MCLDIAERDMDNPLIATEAIVCYKVGIYKCDKTFISSFRMHLYEIGKIETAIMKCQSSFEWDSFEFFVEDGLHSFVNKEDAIDFAKSTILFGEQICVVRCEIPAASKFYRGTWSFGLNHRAIPGFASDALLPVEYSMLYG